MITDPKQGSTGTIPTVVGDFARVEQRSVGSPAIVFKRWLDLIIASGALLFFAPVIILAIVAIIGTSPGSPFFIQKRVGQNGKSFTMYKLRTMVSGAHLHHQPLLQKKKSDARVFPVGRFLRRTSIDELPNLLNVLFGDMSIVGPRPMLENELQFCIERHGIAIASERLQVKPGITGLWQVSGRANLHFDDRVGLDITYARTWTLWGDITILLKTIPVLLLSRGAF